jgi:transcriptional regulator with PAS, ATPase and Fis domain
MPKRARTTRRLEVWLKDTDLALFVLNAQRRLVFFNRGSERLTGWAAPDLLGQKCDYVSEADATTPAALLASLAPPPEAWTGQLAQTPVHLPRRALSPLAQVVHYFPLADADRDVKAMLGVIVPIPDVTVSIPTPASQRLHAELAFLRQSVRSRYGDGSLIGRSVAMRRAFAQVKLAQGSTSPVLFVGETGTGKQHLARVLHYLSPQGKRAFVPLDCRASSQELEQVLTRIRDDQQSDPLRTGAVYFQNLDRAPADFQRTLADWIEQSQVASSIRVLAASEQSLQPLVNAERFSRELYYSLTSIVVEIPPLRERMEDLEPLAQYFVEESNRQDAMQTSGFADDVWRQFKRYSWPGNVAELRQVIVEARKACPEPLIQSEHLPFRFRTGVTAQTMEPSQTPKVVPLDQLLEQVEREQIELALEQCRTNKARAAELLGISRPRLYRRMEVLGIVDLDPTPEPPGDG